MQKYYIGAFRASCNLYHQSNNFDLAWLDIRFVRIIASPHIYKSQPCHCHFGLAWSPSFHEQINSAHHIIIAALSSSRMYISATQLIQNPNTWILHLNRRIPSSSFNYRFHFVT